MKELIEYKLEGIDKALTLIEINDLLELTSVEDYQKLQEEIEKLVSAGVLHKTKKDKYILMKHCTTLESGYIHINKNGNGFVEIKGSKDFFVPKENLNGAVDGDYVEIDTTNEDGVVVNILRRDINVVVGEIIMSHNHLAFEADDKKKNLHYEVTKESLEKCVEGHKVVLKVIKELKKNLYLGEITKVLGHKNDPGVDIMSIAYDHGIFLEFGKGVDEELKTIPTKVEDKDLNNRKDLRDEMIFTIDGEDTKDIDDAISIKKEGNDYILGVHIADVSYYVRENMHLFDSALERGTSSYLADTVIPMLPHELSNGICSLNEGVDRLTISCEMKIDSQGKIVDHDIFLSVINSKKKMTYTCVNEILMEGKVPEGYEDYKEDLLLMHELAKILRKRKINNGYIDFGIDEAKVVQDEEGKAIDIKKRYQLEGEKLIEDFMIAANETVATHVTNMELPFVYRVHDKPNSEKITDFVTLVHQLGYSMEVNINELSPKGMQELLDSLREKPEFEILSEMLLRSMKKAVYSESNIGHFGLASTNYTHFTSPIRRFPDLLVHTLLHKYLFEIDMDPKTIKYYEHNLPSMCEKASEREVQAQEAEREVLDMKMAEFMEDHIGEEHEGVISGVTNFGMFVKLPNLVEGLVHISTLDGFYSYIPEQLSLVSEKNSYRIGDCVKIKVTGASKEMRTIDFEVIGDSYGNKE